MLKKNGKPNKKKLPSTVARSGKKARRTFAEAHDSAADQDGEGERARRTAWAALKHTHQKVGDHWEKTPENGPSDTQAAGGKNTDPPTAGGMDANATKNHLYKMAKELNIDGRSTMSKQQLVAAVGKENDPLTAKARD